MLFGAVWVATEVIKHPSGQADDIAGEKKRSKQYGIRLGPSR